jgi:DNA-binding XRE family transcriptional regulator
MKKADFDISKELMAYRQKHGNTRAEMAAKIGVCELSIYRWESGRNLPKSQYIIRHIKKLISNGSK